MLRPLSPEGLKQVPTAEAPAPRQITPVAGEAGSARVMQACCDFEAIFLTYLLKRMRATVPGGGFLEESRERRLFRELSDEHMAKQLAASGKTGIAEAMYRQIVSQVGADRAAASEAHQADEPSQAARLLPFTENRRLLPLKPPAAAAEDTD
jgi:Rod binding domain-containing protein